jgi:hypothetical protein
MSKRRFDLFTYLAFVPVASMAGLFVYVSRFDGWGAWGAAPLLLLPPLLSIPVTTAGVLRSRIDRAAGRSGRAALGLTLVAALPLLWLLWRLAVSR